MKGAHRLVAIMFTDIVGYTATMQRDEALAIAQVASHKTILESLVERHGGVILNYYGDGSLSIFPSALEAVQCGIDIQTQLSTSHEIPLRIGIHLGDILHENGQYLGDGINIASRIQSESCEGSICISESIRDLVKNTFGSQITSLGVRHLKNVEQPMKLFRIDPGEVKSVQPAAAVNSVRKKSWIWISIPILLLCIIGIKLMIGYSSQPSESDKPSILIIPFENLSLPDENQDYLGAGVADEIRSQLSFNHGLDVKSRGTSQHYSNNKLPSSEIAKQIGVKYILEGSVQLHEGHVKFDLSLTDAVNDVVITPIQYENRNENDLIHIQNEIAQVVVEKIKISLRPEEEQRLSLIPTTNFAAHQNYLLGKYYATKSSSKDDLDQALDYYRKAVQEDRNYAQAYAGISEVLCLYGGWAIRPVHDIIDEAEQQAKTAVALDPNLAEAQLAMGITAMYRENYLPAENYIRKAIEFNPYLDMAHFNLAHIQLYLGKFEDAIASAEKAKQLNPFSPLLYIAKARILRDEERYDEATIAFEDALNQFPKDNTILWQLAVLQIDQGQYQNAIETLQSRTAGKTNWLFGYCYAKLGMESEARSILEHHLKLAEKQYISPAFFACIYWALGEKENAVEWMKKEEMYYFKFFKIIKEIQNYAENSTTI